MTSLSLVHISGEGFLRSSVIIGLEGGGRKGSKGIKREDVKVERWSKEVTWGRVREGEEVLFEEEEDSGG